jgi:hypothetical protein
MVKKMNKEKIKQIEKGFGITQEAKDRYIATDYIIDCNLKKSSNDEPKLVK